MSDIDILMNGIDPTSFGRVALGGAAGGGGGGKLTFNITTQTDITGDQIENGTLGTSMRVLGGKGFEPTDTKGKEPPPPKRKPREQGIPLVMRGLMSR